RRHGNGATNESTRTTRGICDFTSRLVENAVVERLEANADVLSFHYLYRCERAKERHRLRRSPPKKEGQPRLPENPVRGGPLRKIRPARDESPAGRAPILLRDLADNPRTDGAAAFTDG